MTKRPKSSAKLALRLFQLLFGLLFFIAFALFVNALFASRERNPNSGLLTDTSQSSSSIAVITSEQSTSIAGWKLFHEEMLSYSISYPNDWSLYTSKSDGYPYIMIKDPIAQGVVLPQTEIDRGAYVEIYATPWLSQDTSITALKTAMSSSNSLTMENAENKGSKIEVRDSSVGKINGARVTLIIQDRQVEIFSFLSSFNGKPLLFKIVLTTHEFVGENEMERNTYIEVFNQMLQTFELGSSE